MVSGQNVKSDPELNYSSFAANMTILCMRHYTIKYKYCTSLYMAGCGLEGTWYTRDAI